MPVDLAGQPADLDAFAALGLPVVEDAAHAAEARYRGRPVGSIADVTCFSLYATKNIAAGEGGLVATTSDDIAQKIDDLRVMRRGHGSLYDIPVPGYKANLSDVLASIALVQLAKVERHGEARRRQFELYDAAVAELDGIEPLKRDPRDTHAMHLYVVRIDAGRAGGTRDEYQRRLTEENIGSSIHFLPVHRLTAYRDLPAENLPVAERAGRRGAVAAALAGPLGGRHRRRDRRAAPRPRRAQPMSRSDPPPGDAGRHRPCASPTSSGRSTSAKTVDVLKDADPALFALAAAIMIATTVPMAWRWQQLLEARTHPGAALLADPHVLRRLHREPGAADVARRRRGADLRDRQAAPGHRGRRHGQRLPRPRARRNRDGRARGDRLRARLRPLRPRRLLLARARLHPRHRRCSPSSSSRRAREDISAGSCRCSAGSGSSVRSARVYEGIHAYRVDARLLVELRS